MNKKFLINSVLDSFLFYLKIPFIEEEIDDKIINVEKFITFLNNFIEWNRIKIIFFIKTGNSLYTQDLEYKKIYHLFTFLYNLSDDEFKKFVIDLFEKNPYFYNDSIVRKKINCICGMDNKI